MAGTETDPSEQMHEPMHWIGPGEASDAISSSEGTASFHLHMTQLPLIVAHRGASNNAPENTQAAFVLSWIQGADAIEGDFRLTKDGHIVCIHDETTRRTTNRDLVVSQSTLEALRQLDAGGWMSAQWKGQRIPTLEEVLALLPDGKQLFLEMKDGVKMIEPMKKVLDQSQENSKRVLILSFEAEVLAEARKAFPEYRLLRLVTRKRVSPKKPWTPGLSPILKSLDEANLDGAGCSSAGVLHDPECAPAFRAAGKSLHAWTVNRPGNAAALARMGVHSITTDRPGWLKQGMLRALR